MDSTQRADSPGADLLAAVGRHLILFLLPALLLGGGGLAYGLLRHERFTAQSNVSIGALNLGTQGIPGFVTAAKSLAAAYARAVDAPAVTRPAAQAAHVSVAEARDALSASSISDTPMFLVEAETTSAQAAMALANSGANALSRYVVQINRRENLRENVLLKYRRAATKVSEVTLDVGKARAAYIHKQNKRNAARIVGSAARLQSAELHRDSLRNLYVTFSGGELAENLLQVIAPADHATGDRRKVTEQWVLTGVLGGLVVGILLAAMRESVLRRRVASAE